jgi:eukaryotic-like serine/threonine-protein kinase
MSLNTGDTLGPYEVAGVLGKGGMGEVYRARDPRLKRDVAIKVAGTAFSERFQREAEAIAALSHPNICTLFDVGPDYLVMELVEGPTLADVIGGQALPVPEVLRIAGQIVDALEAAHAKHIVHRDLKPANVKVRPDGLVKVLDFGLATVVAPTGSPDESPTLNIDLTAAGMILGTAGYMAPEQARGGVVDHRADVWAFGVMLYEMLSGARLYNGPTVSDTLAAVLLKEPDWTRVPVPELSSLGRLLRWCLEKDPRKRLSDIGMARRLLVEDPAPAVAPALPATASRSSGWMWATAAMGLLAVASAAYISLREPVPAAETATFEVTLPEGARFAGEVAVSPDGRAIAVVVRDPNNRTHLAVRTVASLEMRRLSEAADVVGGVFWSPDSRWIAYSTNSQLKKVSLAGTAPQVVSTFEGSFWGGTWSADGTIVFGSGNKVRGLWKVSSAGGTPAQLIDTRAAAARHPLFLPDGRHFLWTRADSLLEGKVYVGVTDKPAAEWPQEPLLTANGQVQYLPPPRGEGGPGLLLFPRGSAIMAQVFDPDVLTLSGDPRQAIDRVRVTAAGYSVSPAGVAAYADRGEGLDALTWLDRAGAPLDRLANSEGYTELSLSPDGTRAAAVKAGDIWLVDLVRKTSLRFTSDAAEERAPVWSPDGARIVFASNRSGQLDIYERSIANASPERVLLASPRNEFPAGFSPDGKWLLVTREEEATQIDVLLLALTEGVPADQRLRPLLNGPTHQAQATVSPDGRSVAYTSLEAGRVQVYVRSFPDGGDPRKVREETSAEPRWGAGGRELFFRANDASNTMWSVDVSRTGALGTPRSLFRAPVMGAGGFNNSPNYDVSRDGRRLLAVVNAEAARDVPLTVVVNWKAARP